MSNLTKGIAVIAVILAIGAGLVIWKTKVGGGHGGEALNRITREEMMTLLADANPMQLQQLSSDPEAKKKIAENIKQLLAVAGQARKEGLANDPNVQRELVSTRSIVTASRAMSTSEIDALVERQFGSPLALHFFEFGYTASRVALWTEQHSVWLASGVPVVVTLVRADAAAQLADAPLLELLRPWFDTTETEFAAAADDYVRTLTRRLDLTTLAAGFATLAADASSSSVGGFSGPVCYREHSAAGILTTERLPGTTVAALLADHAGPSASPESAAALARQLATAWLRQASTGRVVPFEFTASDVVVDGARLVLTDAVFEPHNRAERNAFLAYADAVAADDADAALNWIMSGAASDQVERHEDEVLRRLRQAVPFRDGEWSGDDRLAEHALVQWGMARQAGWALTPHHVHVYRGLQALWSIVSVLGLSEDVMLASLHDERLRAARSGAMRMLNPFTMAGALNRQVHEALDMPRAIDRLLTLASAGRLHVKLNVPESRRANDVRNRTVLLVATLIVLTGLAASARQLAPAVGPGVERLAAVAVLVLGGWLLVAAARL